jgi:Rrf2 family protein
MSRPGAAGTIRARDLSGEVDVPPSYLSKIMRRLVEAGLLASQKGHGGGFRIAKPLSEIRFADVLLAVDQEVRPEGCAFGWATCSELHPCPLHPFWKVLKDQFEHWAQEHTLQDVRDGRTSGPPRAGAPREPAASPA